MTLIIQCHFQAGCTVALWPCNNFSLCGFLLHLYSRTAGPSSISTLELVSWKETMERCVSFIQVASGMILVMAFFLITYTFHSTWVTSEAYSSPSIVLSARGGDGSRIIFDDFREAYYWLRHNTPEVRLWYLIKHYVSRSLSTNGLIMLFGFLSVSLAGCKSNVMVGLWLSNNCYG